MRYYVYDNNLKLSNCCILLMIYMYSFHLECTKMHKLRATFEEKNLEGQCLSQNPPQFANGSHSPLAHWPPTFSAAPETILAVCLVVMVLLH